MTSSLRIAVVGAGPAGIYAADILSKANEHAVVDLFDRLPTPYGLVRYGVAPDHPRIKEVIKALKRTLNNPSTRFFGNVEYGTDLLLEDLRRHYDGVIFATGARKDVDIDLPGVDLPGSYGAADFVSWYDGHPDVPRDWPLDAKKVAILGAGNVALDIARMMAKTADELLPTEIPHNVYEGLKRNRATDIHLFIRRGPAQVKFTPLELRDLSKSPNIDVIVHPEGFEFDEGSMEAIQKTKATKLVVDILQNWAMAEPEGKTSRIHLHFLQRPVEVLGETAVTGLRTERTELQGDTTVKGTGDFTDWEFDAVYRAVGYRSDALDGIPFDNAAGVVPNEAGRVMDGAEPLPRTYVTGWIKRGPVGLIGHTKSDAAETIACLTEDLGPHGADDPAHDPQAIEDLLHSRDVVYTTADGWDVLDDHEISLGEPHGRQRIKVVEREEMVRISRNTQLS